MAIKIGESEKISDRVLSEHDTRKKFLNKAKEVGSFKDMLKLFAVTDQKMRLCGNAKEREDIAKIAAIMAYNLLGSADGSLTINNEVVIDDRTEEEKSKIIL